MFKVYIRWKMALTQHSDASGATGEIGGYDENELDDEGYGNSFRGSRPLAGAIEDDFSYLEISELGLSD